MKNYSPADMAIKNMLDGMSHNGSTFPGTEALMKEIGAILFISFSPCFIGYPCV